MANISFRKERISVRHIGQLRFWIGVASGLFSAVIISLAFNYSRECFRYESTISSDLFILEAPEQLFFNYFFSALATVLGLSVSLWIWMGNRNHYRKNDRLYKQAAVTHASLIFWVILMVVARFGSILPLIFLGIPWSECLPLYDDFWLMFVLIPLVVFLQNWFSVRMIYRAGRWILYTFLLCIPTTIALQFTTGVDQEKVNQAYYLKYQEDYQYIDEQISIAKTQYGVEFRGETIEILKKYISDNSSEQVARVKSAFASQRKVTMDTIIMQKIMVRNYKENFRKIYDEYSTDFWDYAMPVDVLRQMGYFAADSHEIRELMEVLKEQIDLVNTPEIGWQDLKSHTDTEIRRSCLVKWHTPPVVLYQLERVRELLLKDARYSELAKQLPAIDWEEIKNRISIYMTQ